MNTDIFICLRNKIFMFTAMSIIKIYILNYVSKLLLIYDNSIIINSPIIFEFNYIITLHCLIFYYAFTIFLYVYFFVSRYRVAVWFGYFSSLLVWISIYCIILCMVLQTSDAKK